MFDVSFYSSVPASEPYFDICNLFQGTFVEQVILNWQKRTSFRHYENDSAFPGRRAITGVRAHPSHYVGAFNSVEIEVEVTS
jgi:hypothetical protein